jgi:hypothetical protein
MGATKRKNEIVAIVGDVIPQEDNPLPPVANIVENEPSAKRPLSESRLASLQKARDRALELRTLRREQDEANRKTSGGTSDVPDPVDPKISSVADVNSASQNDTETIGQADQHVHQKSTGSGRKRGRPTTTTKNTVEGESGIPAPSTPINNDMMSGSIGDTVVATDVIPPTNPEDILADPKTFVTPLNRKSSVRPKKIVTRTTSKNLDDTSANVEESLDQPVAKRRLDFDNIVADSDVHTTPVVRKPRKSSIGFQRSHDGIFYFNR